MTGSLSLRLFRRLLTLVAMAALAACGPTRNAPPPEPVAVTGAAVPSGPTARAIFAGGCFWCVEADFDKLPGVLATISGYTGGKTANPSYQEVSSNMTGHAEVLEVVFDPARVSYAQLVDHFWRTIDPTTKDRQFCDVGTPYRTAIFAVGAEQLQLAQAARAALKKSKPFQESIVTDVLVAEQFYPAEEYHQDYYRKNAVRYNYYRTGCGRDARLKQLWGAAAVTH